MDWRLAINSINAHSVSIGDRGTESPALYDPRSILFDRPSNLLAFPVATAHMQDPDPNEPWLWGDTATLFTKVSKFMTYRLRTVSSAEARSLKFRAGTTSGTIGTGKSTVCSLSARICSRCPMPK
jgi:hypothetical protein